MNPQDVGVPESSIVLTARSGRHALRHRLELLGFTYDKSTLDIIYNRFLDMADIRKQVNDKDLVELVNTELVK
jgi:2-isopropylmalate synthase